MLKQIKISQNKINNFEFIKINNLEIICFDGEYSFQNNLLTLENDFVGIVKLHCFRKFYDYINYFTITYFDNTNFINDLIKGKDLDLVVYCYDGILGNAEQKRILGKFENLKDLINYIKSQLAYNEYLTDDSYKNIFKQLKS